MFSYICLGTNDLGRAIVFYDAVLAPLGLQRCQTPGEENWDNWAGWGTYEAQGERELALWLCTPFDGQAATVSNGATAIPISVSTETAAIKSPSTAPANARAPRSSPLATRLL